MSKYSIWGLLYGIDLISFKSIFDYWHPCVSCKYSVRLNIHEFIYFDWLVFRQKFELIPFSFPLELQVHALLYYVGFAIYIQIIAEWLRSYSWILTHPSYDPTFHFPVNFCNSVILPFIFLNFNSDALHCHLF